MIDPSKMDALLNELYAVEAWADGLKEHCRKARKLIEAGVSTPAKGQTLTDAQLADISAKRRSRMLKKRK